ncbi:MULTISPECIES: 1,4-dihydroxy-2-naphthoate octaprenyltransferase [Muribaculum]|jgi:1,4-dihydroxy-2-naphthoate octaprenyltransferase|uniref:1,4-dihydroxy-2-naphthoate octaprenyltransferase n=1 Tax=Muribaculum caecicola TaxID=3038144 RepID=A0AC61S5C1_9BACT|nr:MULTISPECIES: 1,4-dihydroxy-2-naphthoate octaprenyltransferase [Muribaculum]THG51657.1 1,4-dihydroxy-2-naphthoate octaprenyltransferase [Muribaculum caecicola]
MSKKIKTWVEAVRVRTLPVSIAGVLSGAACAVTTGQYQILPIILCLLFAILAQTASNFANEYYDFRAGFDKAGREGPRRGVTEGDITPSSMRTATFVTLGLACGVGCSLIYWGGWWLIAVGLLIAIGVMAYSTGPYPLSHHGLGEIAVMIFFGIIPVNFTCYLATGSFSTLSVISSVITGLMGTNVLLVNNYRDQPDDAAVGKRTLAVIFGTRFASLFYMFNGIVAAVLAFSYLPGCSYISAGYLVCHLFLYNFMRTHRGAVLNPILGMTACLMLLFSILQLVVSY